MRQNHPSSFLSSSSGANYVVPVIDVTTLQDEEMALSKFAAYWTDPASRTRVLNVLGLNVSDTELGKEISLPRLVRELGWAQILGIEKETKSVAKYVLFSTGNSYTDFHVDFGGSSVWYHVPRGHKIFYLIRPTEHNLCLFERWSSMSAAAAAKRDTPFFGDLVDCCYKVHLREGGLVLMPGGWIHAVFTPVDTVAIAGNFLQIHSISMQLRISELEGRNGEPAKYRFPHFTALHELIGKHYLELLGSCVAHLFIFLFFLCSLFLLIYLFIHLFFNSN